MNARRANDPDAVQDAMEIARRTLAGELDSLRACVRMVALRNRLSDVPESAMDTFVAVASEVDDLPLGSERTYWSPDVLEAQDLAAADYRVRTASVVQAAMKELLAALEGESSA